MDSLSQDPDAYRATARRWLEHGFYCRIDENGHPVATAYRAPLYPTVLAGLEYVPSPILALAVLHGLVGGLTCWMVWYITRKLIGRYSEVSMESSPMIGPWLAGVGTAIDPILLKQSTLTMTETLGALLVVAVWGVWLRLIASKSSRQVWALSTVVGVILGFNILLRPSHLSWLLCLAPALGVVGILKRFRPNRRCTMTNSKDEQRIQNERELAAKSSSEIRWIDATIAEPKNAAWISFTGIALGSLLVLSPWALRNRSLMGETIWTTTHGGYTLLLANNAFLYQHFQAGNWGRDWDSDAFHRYWEAKQPRNPFDELKADQVATMLAWQTIIDDPATAIKSSIARLGWFWALWPAADGQAALTTLAVGSYYAIVTVLFSVSVFLVIHEERIRGRSLKRIEWSSPWLICWTLLLGLSLIHSVFWSNMRMRGPAMPCIYVAIGAATIRFAKWSRRT